MIFPDGVPTAAFAVQTKGGQFTAPYLCEGPASADMLAQAHRERHPGSVPAVVPVTVTVSSGQGDGHIDVAGDGLVLGHGDSTTEAVIARIDLRFQSGNTCPVTRAHLSAEEWDHIRARLRMLDRVPNATAREYSVEDLCSEFQVPPFMDRGPLTPPFDMPATTPFGSLERALEESLQPSTPGES